jgi:hypothetical protein
MKSEVVFLFEGFQIFLNLISFICATSGVRSFGSHPDLHLAQLSVFSEAKKRIRAKSKVINPASMDFPSSISIKQIDEMRGSETTGGGSTVATNESGSNVRAPFSLPIVRRSIRPFSLLFQSSEFFQ